MRAKYVILILLAAGCKSRQTENTPSIKFNTSINEVWLPIQDIVSEKDFSIVYSEGGGAMTEPSWPTHRIFCRKDSTWEKYEIKMGFRELDTADSEFGIVEKDLLLKKTCSVNEAKLFYDSLIELGIFRLESEKEILSKCKALRGGKDVPEYDDLPGITIYIIQDNKVWSQFYNYPLQRIIDCPDMQELHDIASIIRLFKTNWYHQQHY